MPEREIDRVIATKAPIRGVVGFKHAVLGERTDDYIFTPVCDNSGNVEAIAGTTRDITDIKRAAEHLTLLLDELNHRVKNTFATIQAISAYTLRSARDLPSARDALEQRIVSMAKAHDLLTAHSWTGANLLEVVARAIDAFSPSRVTIRGDAVDISSKHTLALSLALHELATNATKYGALSSAEGRVEIEWTRENGTLQLDWREKGGPAVVVPEVRGFGSRLIEQLARYWRHHQARLRSSRVALQHRRSALATLFAARRPSPCNPLKGGSNDGQTAFLQDPFCSRLSGCSAPRPSSRTVEILFPVRERTFYFSHAAKVSLSTREGAETLGFGRATQL